VDNLWGSLSQRVEAQLGRPLPEHPPDDVADPEFLTLLNQLRQTDPDLAEEVINAYTGTSERLPSEAEAASERRRQRVHRHLFSRFLRPDGLRTGRVRLNLRKTLNWIAAAVAVFVIIWSLIPKSARVSAPARRAAPAASQTVTQPAPSAAPTVSTSPTPSPALSPIPPSAPRAGAPTTPPLEFSPPGFPQSVPDADWPGVGAPPPPLPGVPMTTASQVVVFEASRAQQEPTSPVVYQREESQASAQQSQVAMHTSPNGAASTQSPGLVVVYDASAAKGSAGTPVMAPPVSEPSAQAAALPTQRGQLLEVRLVAPVAVTSSGGVTPALVEIAQGPLQGALLVGQATRSPEGLVLIQFNTLIAKDGKEQPFRGAAYDAQVGRLGVAGQVSTMMPGTASALLAATMQSVSDYFKARAQKQQVTVTNGFLTITQGTPSLWDGLAAAIARAFAPSAQSTTGPTVVARLERGQTITVLVM
jgi:hypothetical protein